MNPLLGIAAAVLPDIIKLVAGDKTGQLEAQVGKAVSDTLGTADPAEAQTKLTADPAAQAALRQKLTELALDATKAQNAEVDQQRQYALDNTQGARGALEELARTNTTIARTAPIISYIVIVGFFIFLGVLVWLYKTGATEAADGATPGDRNSFIPQIINITVGALTAAFATVVNFWLGSSAGSQKKDDANLTLQQTQSERNSATINALQNKIPSAPPAALAAIPVSSQAPAKPSSQQSSARFDACMPFIFKAEGGYSDNPNDPGGPTNFGITLKTLETFEGQTLTVEDVRNLTPATAREIYRANYWNRMQCGSMPAGLDLEVFDFGVNAGPAEAVKMLQKIVGVTQDGSVGPITLAALAQFKAKDVIGRYSDARLAYYKALNDPEFEQGWSNRVSQIQIAALNMLDQTAVA